ncbi:MAG: hypothetical protein AAF828_00010 [Bacteroidota bacterium]
MLNYKRWAAVASLFLFLTVSLLDAQELSWETDLYKELNKVSWIEQAYDGTVVAAGDKGLLGLNHQDGSIKWQRDDLKAVDRNTYFNIDGLPLFYVEYEVFGSKRRGIIINAHDGTILYDTEDDDLRIKEYTFLPEKNSILFEGVIDKEHQLLNFDLENLQVKWMTAVGEQTVASAFGGRRSFLTQGPIFDKAGHLIVGIKDMIYAIDYATGNLKWSMETDKRIKALVYSPANNSLYLGIRKEKKLTVLDPATGEDITPGKLKLKGTMLDVLENTDGNLILVETAGFNIIDPKTNDFLWKKSYKINALEEVIPYNGSFIAIGKSESLSEVHLVDASGEGEWDAKIKGYAYFVTPTPKGIMYISTERSNILDYGKGKDVWKKDVKFKSIPAVAYDNQTDKVFLFENKNAYLFDLDAGSIDLIGENLKLAGVRKKSALLAETLPAGFFVSDEFSYSLIDRNGKIVWTREYQPLKSTNLLSLGQFAANVSGIDIDITGNIQNFNTLKNISNGAYRSAGRQSGSQKERRRTSVGVGSGDQYTELFNVTTTRFANSQETKDHQFLTAKGEAAGEKFIYMIDKASGEVVKQIALIEKDPGYVIDVVDNVVFLNEKTRRVKAFKMD